MKYIFLSFLFLFHFSVFGQPALDTSSLQAFLNLDRFEAYSKAWAANFRGKKPEALVNAVQSLTASEIQAMNLDPVKLADAKNYDDLILQALKKKNPRMRVAPADVEWGYNFFKMKMNEGYLVNDVRAPRERAPAPMPDASRATEVLEAGPLDSSEVLLDVDGYASDRTTRAVFWEASDTGRRIELFPGSASAFQDEMARRGAKVVAAVGTKARNYNPIYLIQNPGETGYHYAITEISGADRLRHFQMQVSLVRWQRPGQPLRAPAPVSVVGSAANVLAEEERALTGVLRSVPRADHIVIGQKGALERTFGSLGKIQAIMAMNATDSAALARTLTPNELKIVNRAQEAGGDLTQFVMKYASDIDKLYVKTEPLLTTHNLQMKPFTAYNYDRGTYEMSDYILRGANGQEQRWRVFSNVWGDEVLPIARSLRATGYNSVNYIGTAGAFVGTDLKVGDLVIPTNAATLDGTLTRIPRTAPASEGSRAVSAVVNVQSPFEETGAWLAEARRSSQVVEVETGYLASVFNRPTDNLNVQLLISDVVGSEHETLATAQSSSRRRAQINALSSIVNAAEVRSTVPTPPTEQPLMRWMQELYPTRDPASQVQLVREAQAAGISTKSAFDDFIKTQKSFTTAKLEQVLRGADAKLGKVLTALRSAGINPIVAYPKRLFDGRFNPAVGGVELQFVTGPENQARMNQIISELSASDRDLAKFLKIEVATDIGANFHNVGFSNSTVPTIKNVYQDGMVAYGGLGFTENSSGALKFVRVGEVSSQPLSIPTLGQITTSARCSITNFGQVMDNLLR